MFNKKQKEIDRLKCRVKELEERICPCSSHEWVRVSVKYIYIGGSPETVGEYKCRKCGKERSSMFDLIV